MTKLNKGVFALAVVAATSLTACGGKKKDVSFWSSFGGAYTQYLDPIVEDIAKDLNMTIDHVSKKSYPGVLDAMVSAIATGKYPSIAVGYPDHFAQYHGSKILRPLDSLAADIVGKFDQNYMPENYLVDQDGSKHLYGLPFNKSTELLGYNRVFVDYCASLYPDKDLLNLPATWAEWADYENPDSKVSLYKKTFDELINSKAKLYALQAEDGHATDFSLNVEKPGYTLALDYTKADINTTRLFTWDSVDNAFITLVRQWGAQYTKLPEDQYQVALKKRAGTVLFANNDNLERTVDMLKFFNKLHKQRIFGTPADFGGNTSYSSDPFKHGSVMFVVCSSGGMAHNTGTWHARFTSAPIPYKDADKKFVISQGANICLTKNGDEAKAFAVMKALTVGKYQTKWAMDTGYFPASSDSENSTEYQEFLNGTSYADELSVYKREGAKTNHDYYSKEDQHWTRFVDDAFIGSAAVRENVAFILPNVFKEIGADSLEDDAKYRKEIKDVLNLPSMSGNTNINIDFADVLK